VRVCGTWFLGDWADSGSSAASTELLMRMQMRMKLPHHACEQNLKQSKRNLITHTHIYTHCRCTSRMLCCTIVHEEQNHIYEATGCKFPYFIFYPRNGNDNSI